MSLASVFQRKKNASPRPAGDGAGDAADALQWERVRARRRLIGAVLLLALGILGFPLLFETEPRPLPRDLPIEVARRDAGTVGVTPAPVTRPAPTLPPLDAGVEQASGVATGAVPAAAKSPSAAATATGPAASAPLPRAASASAAPAVPAQPRPAATPASTAAASVARSSPASSVPVAPRVESPTPAAAAGGLAVDSAPRFVVQVGAFTDAVALREARQRVEKLGLKTYTQVIETPSGNRTRVRVGPFATREEADQAGARLKAAGLPAYLLAL